MVTICRVEIKKHTSEEIDITIYSNTTKQFQYFIDLPHMMPYSLMTCSRQAMSVLLVLMVGCYDLTNAEKLYDGSTSICDIPSSSQVICVDTVVSKDYAKHECNQKKCCWQAAKNGNGVPSCYYSRNVLKPSGKSDNATILSWFYQFPWSIYATDTLNQAHEYDRGTNYPRVYYAIFAGRSKYLDIHLKYCDILLRLNYITEVHLWDFTGNGWDFTFDNFENKNYLARFVRDTPMEGYRLFQKSSSKNNRFRRRSTKSGSSGFEDYDYRWGSFYEHYAYNKRYRDTDILIKADDDIVYMDLSHFARFINDISSYADGTTTHLHFPNIINNDAGFIVQADFLPNSSAIQKWVEFYTSTVQLNLTNQLARGYDNFYHNLHKLTEPLTTWKYGVYTQDYFLFDFHELFLKDPKAFIDAMCVQVQTSRFVKINKRISLNMYAGDFISIRKYFTMFLHLFCCEDESFVGAIPSITGDSHIMHAHFVISHFAFFPQTHPENEHVLASIRDVYEDIAEVFEKVQLNRTESTTLH